MSTQDDLEAASKAVAGPSFEGVVAARRRIGLHSPPTPLYRSPLLSQLLDADVWIKNESVTPIASFKLRGAFNALLVAQQCGALSRAVTSSTGNHGQAVAYAGQALKVPVDIFLPERPNETKRAVISSLGANIHIGGHDIDDAKERARTFSLRNGATFIDDGESVDVVEGAGTIGLEIGEALRDVDVAFVPTGSGSLVAGVAAGLKGIQPSARVVAVQSTGSPAMVESFHARRIVVRSVDTLADCIVCRVPAVLALTAMIGSVDDALLVTDEELFAALRSLICDGHVLAELGSAAALAGAWKQRRSLQGRRVVIIVTGANLVPEHLAMAMSARPLH